jgi:hypothetical protein
MRSTGLTWRSVGVLIGVALGVLLAPGVASASSAIMFSKGPEMGVAPPSLGPYTMHPFSPGGPQDEVSEVPGPTGAIELAPEMILEEYPYANGIPGSMFRGTETEMLTLPPNTGAFYLYASWGCDNCGGGPGGSPGVVTVNAEAQDGTSSGALTVAERPDASYFGFYAECGASLKTLTLHIAGSNYTPSLMIGEFGISPTSANSNCPTAGTPVPEPAPTEPEPGSIEECEPASTPENNLVTPLPPIPTEGEIARRHVARIASFSRPSVANPYCEYKAKYTKAEKEAAHQWYLFYNEEASNGTMAASGLGAVAAGLAAVPEPVISKGGAAATAIIAGAVGVTSGYLSKLANQMESVEHDPPDPNWRTTATRPRTFPRRLPVVHGLHRRQQAAIDAYLTGILDETADSECEEESINRASTALANKDPAEASVQYRAGSACAADNATVAKQLPRMGARAKPVIAILAKALDRAPLKRYIAAHFGAFERDTTLRDRGAARTVAALARVIALPPAILARMQAALADHAPRSAIAPNKILRALLQPPKLDNALRILQEQTAKVLGAAAAK